MELQKPPIPPTVLDVEERKRRAFADVDEFTVTIHKRSLYVLQLTPKESDKVWCGVCRNKKKSIAIYKSFLADYTRYARCRRLYINGTEEQKQVPSADAVVLAKRRDQDSNEDLDEDSEQWTLLGNRGKARGEVIQFNLICKQTFEKTEATIDDILLILSTLWERAVDIPCDPRYRLAFHILVLIEGIGFRPGTYKNMLYQQVKLLVVEGWDAGKAYLSLKVLQISGTLEPDMVGSGEQKHSPPLCAANRR
ncbi:hypothetical protein QBC32DRAFT_401647 [Pseudoneurospora amorphoporcata]|uniref:Uncharacterized protein n=1 Tax=Pseudoneurospora amorphoporcata TaxID=241081 RepID=A0AAN6NM27_9PEZI|nr:hypothetical protein QBC32DRAFT_401647 [Pseudoneurospora amorphoporcata]